MHKAYVGFRADNTESVCHRYPSQNDLANLIRKIQIAEGHVDCFATGKTHCEQMGCRWRKDCLPESAEDAPAEPESAPSNKERETTS